jgi:transcriptional regulator with XRE-family HTH domain
MPRSPSHYSIVREIRKRLGLTQTQLAARLKVAWVTLNRIENDHDKLSRRIALLLSEQTGVLFGDIMKNRQGVLRTWYGTLSSERLPLGDTRRDKFARALGSQHLKTLIGNAEYRAELILGAMMEAAPQKVWTLDGAIEIAFDQLEQEFGLQEIVERLRRAPAPLADWIRDQVGPPPVNLLKEMRAAVSGRSMEDRAARKLAALKKRPPISSRAKSSKKRRRRAP